MKTKTKPTPKKVPVKLWATPMKYSEIPAVAKALEEDLLVLHLNNPVFVIAAANVIMQTAANIRLTATLKALNEKATYETKKARLHRR